jgi:hypothetical protein
MLDQISTTITQRFASHVWQRIFEVKWKRPFPLLYDLVNCNLGGNWTRIANDEHGSLVVQCIFENADMRQREIIICEILSNLPEVAKGMYCILKQKKLLKIKWNINRSMGKLCDPTHP